MFCFVFVGCLPISRVRYLSRLRASSRLRSSSRLPAQPQAPGGPVTMISPATRQEVPPGYAQQQCLRSARLTRTPRLPGKPELPGYPVSPNFAELPMCASQWGSFSAGGFFSQDIHVGYPFFLPLRDPLAGWLAGLAGGRVFGGLWRRCANEVQPAPRETFARS